MRDRAIILCVALLVGIVFLSGCSGKPAGTDGTTVSPTLPGNSGASDPVVLMTPATENSPVVTSASVRTETTSAPVRLTSGTFLKKTIGGGFGEMKIINGNKDDSVVIITHPATPRTARDSVYIQGGGFTTVPSFPNGEYSVYFTTGTDWNATAGRFNRDAVYKKFTESVRFSSEGNRYQIWTIKIGSLDRDAKTEDVSMDKFPLVTSSS